MEDNVVRHHDKHDGPCRETAHTMLKRMIADLRRKADEYEALLKAIGPVDKRMIADLRRKADEYEALLKAIGPVEAGNPAEVALWGVLQNQRHERW